MSESVQQHAENIFRRHADARHALLEDFQDLQTRQVVFEARALSSSIFFMSASWWTTGTWKAGPHFVKGEAFARR